jgi:hypothetical protein
MMFSLGLVECPRESRGVSGFELGVAEREFIRAGRPWGFILFKRNIETRVKYPLVMELRNFLDKTDAPVLIDQEGGPVVRLDRRISRSIRSARPSATPRWARRPRGWAPA